MTPQAGPGATGSRDPLAAALHQAEAAARAHGRADLEARLRLSVERMTRAETVVCVAGEFKQGKSSLINALMGVAACPVDDDLATAAVTVVRHAPEVRIAVTRRQGGERVLDTIDPSSLPEYVTERGNPGNERHVELVEIHLPNPLLDQGWVFVDTPGIGGFSEAQAAAALAFLPAADALLFVTDASSELTASELAFLGRARGACPTVVVALTKIDLHPFWRPIADADSRHLAAIGLPAALPVSAALRAIALRRADAQINAESGTTELLERLHADAYVGAHRHAAARAVDDARLVIRELSEPLRRELAVVRHPGAAASVEAELAAARARLRALRGPAARWGQRLGDLFGELSSSVDYAFRARMRGTLRAAEDAIDASDPARGWEQTATRLQADVATAVGDTFREVIEGSARIRREIAALIQEASVGEAAPPGRDLEVERLWSGKVLHASPVRSGLGLGFGALRGAQSGVYMLGLLGNLFHLAVLGPALLGGAALFAGKSLVDERKRQLGQRRQEARVAIRQYLDDVQFEVGARVRDLLRDQQRDLRDDVAARIDEIARTNADTAASLERTLKDGAATRQRRAQALEHELAALQALDGQLAARALPTPVLTASAATPPAAHTPGRVTALR